MDAAAETKPGKPGTGSIVADEEDEEAEGRWTWLDEEGRGVFAVDMSLELGIGGSNVSSTGEAKCTLVLACLFCFLAFLR